MKFSLTTDVLLQFNLFCSNVASDIRVYFFKVDQLIKFCFTSAFKIMFKFFKLR